MDGKKIFCVKDGEEFDIHVMGPVQTVADPSGIIGGSTFEYIANRKELVKVRAYTTDVYQNGPNIIKEV